MKVQRKEIYLHALHRKVQRQILKPEKPLLYRPRISTSTAPIKPSITYKLIKSNSLISLVVRIKIVF